MRRALGLVGLGFLALATMAPTPAVNVSVYDLTAGTGTGLTVNHAGAFTRNVYKVTTTYAAFSAAATTADKTIATLPAQSRLCGIYADVTEAFSGGAVATATLTAGTSAGGNNLLLLADVKTAVISLGLTDATLGTLLARATKIQDCALVSLSTTTPISARITTTVDNTDALTAGSVTWWLVVDALP